MIDAVRSPDADRRAPGLLHTLMTAPLLAGVAAVVLVLVIGWAWVAQGRSTLDRVLQLSELKNDLQEAHTSLLGARVALYERDYLSAGRRLENARALLRRAEERGRRQGLQVEVSPHDVARFEADINEARRLLALLEQNTGTPAVAPDMPGRLRANEVNVLR